MRMIVEEGKDGDLFSETVFTVLTCLVFVCSA